VFVGTAAKTANTGQNPNGTKVDELAVAVYADDADNLGAIAAAQAAVSSVTAAGQILGGRSINQTDDQLKTLAGIAATDKKLKKAIQSVSQFVGANADDAKDFAHDVAAANLGSLSKIAPGVAAGQPDEAANILTELFLQADTKPTTVKSATKLASSMSLVADTEVVTDMAIEFGARLNAGDIKIKSLTGLAKGLVKGLTNKPATDTTLGVRTRDSLVNKLDEIGEVAAYMLKQVGANAALNNAKKTPNLVIKFIKTLVKTAKIKTIVAFQNEAADDVSGSVAQTLFSLNAAGVISPDVFTAIKNKLLAASTAKKIGGKTLAPIISAALTAGINGTAGTKYEDGTLPPFTIELTTPETDNRNG
jgi:hypothetical protein